MTFCNIFRNNSVNPDQNMDYPSPDGLDLEPSLVIFSLGRDDKEMVAILTKRLIMYIGVQGSVESLLGAIFEIYMRNGFIGEGIEKTNICNIFADPVIKRLKANYGPNSEVMGVIGQYCYFKECQALGEVEGQERSLWCCAIL